MDFNSKKQLQTELKPESEPEEVLNNDSTINSDDDSEWYKLH